MCEDRGSGVDLWFNLYEVIGANSRQKGQTL